MSRALRVPLERRLVPRTGVGRCSCARVSSGAYFEPPAWQQDHDCPYHGYVAEARFRQWAERIVWRIKYRGQPF